MICTRKSSRAMLIEAFQRYYDSNLDRYVGEHPGKIILLSDGEKIKEAFYEVRGGLLEQALKNARERGETVFTRRISAEKESN